MVSSWWNHPSWKIPLFAFTSCACIKTLLRSPGIDYRPNLRVDFIKDLPTILCPRPSIILFIHR